MDPLTLALEAAPKALVYGATLLAVGVCAARRLAGRIEIDGAAQDQRFTRLVGRVGLVLLAALAARAAGHTAAVFGPAAAFDWHQLEIVAVESGWGQAWQRQMAAALLFAVLAWSAAHWGPLGWSLAEIGAAALCYAVPLTGHAAGDLVPVLVHGTHLLAGGLWLGTLVAAVLLTRSVEADRIAARLPGASPRAFLTSAALLAPFAPLAVSGAVGVLLTGLVMAFWYLGGATEFLATPYAWTLLVKVSLVADAATLGFLNWRALHRGTTAATAGPRVVFLAAEAAAAVAVVLASAVLTELEHP
ncbi:MAG: CopD family protein [Vicinamibacterales bacterium]